VGGTACGYGVKKPYIRKKQRFYRFLRSCRKASEGSLHPQPKQAVRQFNFRAKTLKNKVSEAFKSEKKEFDYY